MLGEIYSVEVIDIADLLDVELAEGDAAALAAEAQPLQRIQRVEHGAVVDGDRQRALQGIPCRGAPLQPGEAVRVEEAAAIGGEAEVLVTSAAMDGAAGGEKAVPAKGGTLQGVLPGLGRRLAQRRGEGAGGVGRGIGIVIQRKQALFLGVEEEDEAHENGDGGRIHVRRLDRLREQPPSRRPMVATSMSTTAWDCSLSRSVISS